MLATPPNPFNNSSIPTTATLLGGPCVIGGDFGTIPASIGSWRLLRFQDSLRDCCEGSCAAFLAEMSRPWWQSFRKPRLKLAAVHGICLFDVQGELWQLESSQQLQDAAMTKAQHDLTLPRPPNDMRPAPVAWYRFQDAILPGEGYEAHVSNLATHESFSVVFPKKKKRTSSSSTAARPSASVRRR